MTFEITGQHNSATVYTNKEREQCEEEALAQIQEMTDSKAFVGDNNISIMPDFHWGSGAVIGFTMPVTNRVVPNTIGVDIGCGMFAADFGQIREDELMLDYLDQEVRNRIPTGFDVHSRNDYHMIDDFPWGECRRKLRTFDENTEFAIPNSDEQYTDSYFNELCEKVDYDVGRAINSMGTLGGGNHFIEFGRDSRDHVWAIIHSGSRGIGASIAEYWQERATDLTTKRKSIDNVPEEVREYMTDSWKPKVEKIRDEFDGEEIQQMFDSVSQAIQKYGPHNSDRNTDLDYLEGDEAIGYIIDMIFAQTYASESRKKRLSALRGV